MPAALTFRPARADEPPGADLLEAMLAELEPLYGRIDVPGAPTASPAELAPPRGASLVGRLAGEPVACGGVMRLDRATCEIRRMYVAPPARRRGVARALLVAVADEARRLGYARTRLDTGRHQPHAERLYREAGYARSATSTPTRSRASGARRGWTAELSRRRPAATAASSAQPVVVSGRWRPTWPT